MKNNRLLFVVMYQLILLGSLKASQRPSNNVLTADLITNLSYIEMQSAFDNSNDDHEKKFLADHYLSRAKRDNNSQRIIEGYKLLIELDSYEASAIHYADSLILVAEKNGNSQNIIDGYLSKAILLYNIKELPSSITLFQELRSKKALTELQRLTIDHYIAVIQNQVNPGNSGLSIFAKNVQYFRDLKAIPEDHQDLYVKSMFALTNAYNIEGRHDEAIKTAEEGVVLSKVYKPSLAKHFELLIFASRILKKEVFDSTTLQELSNIINSLTSNKPFYAAALLIQFEAQLLSNGTDDAYDILLKLDELYLKYPETRIYAKEAYVVLSKFYQHKGKEVPNHFLQNIEEINNDLTYHSGFVNGALTAQPGLVVNNSSNEIKLTLYVILLIILSIVIGFIAKITLFKRKNHPSENKEQINLKNTSDISAEIVDSISRNLDDFEKSSKFLDKNITIQSLAKDLGTNTTYLSRVINKKKKLSFRSYINSLRIKHALNQIRVNPTIRNYTLDSLAKEFGFNSSRTFKKEFTKYSNGVEIKDYLNKFSTV